MSAIVNQLVSAGLSPLEAERKARLFGQCESALGGEVARWFVPGRIEVLGKHTDYAGGRSLLCTAERGMCIVAAKRADRLVRITDVLSGDRLEFAFGPEISVADRGWRAYPTTVARRLARNFPSAATGADVAFASDLPRASGMSSSSVLVIGIYTVLAHINALGEQPEYTANIRSQEDLAGYLGCVENGQSFGSLSGDAGVGTFGGSEDHTAILCCRAGKIAQYSFCPVRYERSIPVPADSVFVIGASGVSASKTGNVKQRYNDLSRSARCILETANRSLGTSFATLAAAVHEPAVAEEIRSVLKMSSHSEFSPEFLTARFDQFLLESEELIPSAGDALAKADMSAFGRLVARSQSAAEHGLQNQIQQTVSLARTARELGAYASSAFGAGFGGGVWALVPRNQADTFCSAWREGYVAKFAPSARSEFFVTQAGPSLLRIE